MKRISPGTVTVGVFAILFGLVAAYVVRHYLDGPAAPPGYRAVTLQVDANSALNGMIQPESHVDVTLTVKGERVRESLEATVASGAGEPAPAVRISAASGNVPTLAPPQDMPHPAAEPRFDRQPRGQVVYVQVEAEGAGGEKN